jgi:hypothetical protein
MIQRCHYCGSDLDGAFFFFFWIHFLAPREVPPNEYGHVVPVLLKSTSITWKTENTLCHFLFVCLSFFAFSNKEEEITRNSSASILALYR